MNKLDPKRDDPMSDEETENFYAWFVDRVGTDYLRDRINAQVAHELRIMRKDKRIFYRSYYLGFLKFTLKMLGVYNWGYQNFLDIQIVQNEVRIQGLPASFHGYKILHISDLHIDIEPKLVEIIHDRLTRMTYDICVVTGDFRFKTSGDYQPAIDLTLEALRPIQKPVYAILGNHDYIELVHPLETKGGMRFLLNQSVPLQKEGETIYLTGVDDPHLYKLADFDKALAGIPADATKILLAHAPEAYQSAITHQFDFMMCGHTHGGQICLPGQVPIITELSGSPRKLVAGAWEIGRLRGYTSRGAGGSGVPVRYFCPPEMTLHTLKCG